MLRVLKRDRVGVTGGVERPGIEDSCADDDFIEGAKRGDVEG